jgi:hypothetical protein
VTEQQRPGVGGTGKVIETRTGGKRVPEIIPPDAVLEKLHLGDGDILILRFPGESPEGTLDDVANLLAHVRRPGGIILVLTNGATVESAPPEFLEKTLEEVWDRQKARGDRPRLP